MKKRICSIKEIRKKRNAGKENEKNILNGEKQTEESIQKEGKSEKKKEPMKYKVSAAVLALFVIGVTGGITIRQWQKEENNDTANRQRFPEGMSLDMEGMEDVVTGSGLTSVGMEEDSYTVDFLENGLYVEETYLSTGDQVSANTPVFKVSDESLEAARKELEEKAKEAELAYREGVVTCEVGKIEAESTWKQAEIEASYAESEKQKAEKEAQQSVEELEAQVQEAQELVDEYTKSIESNYYYEYYKVKELQDLYYDNFELLMTMYEKWQIEDMEEEGNQAGGTSGSSGMTGGASSGTSQGIGSVDNQYQSSGSSNANGNTSGGASAVGNTNVSTRATGNLQDTFVVSLSTKSTDDSSESTAGSGSEESGGSGNEESDGDTGSGNEESDGSTGSGGEENSGNTGSEDEEGNGSTGSGDGDSEEDNGENTGENNGENDGQEGEDSGEEGEHTDEEKPEGEPSFGGMSGGREAQGMTVSEDAIKKNVYDSLDQEVQENKADYEEALENYEEAKAKAEAGIDEAKSNLEILKAELEEAKIEYEKQKIQIQADYDTAISNQQTAQTVYDTTVEKLEEELDTLEEEKEDAEKNLAEFEELIGDGYFYTSADGTIVMNMVQEGNWLTEETVVVAFSNPDTVSVSVQVDEADIASISIGEEAVAVVSGYGTCTGTVKEINPISQSDSRSSVTYSVTVELEKGDGNLESNLSASVYFGLTEEMKEMLTNSSSQVSGNGQMPAGEQSPEITQEPTEAQSTGGEQAPDFMPAAENAGDEKEGNNSLQGGNEG